MDSEEASLSLSDPDDNDVDFGGGENGYSGISAACDCARDIASEGEPAPVDPKDDNYF